MITGDIHAFIRTDERKNALTSCVIVRRLVVDVEKRQCITFRFKTWV